MFVLQDWNTFLENFADVEFCVLGNSSDADIYNPSTSPKLSNALSGLQKNFPGSVSHNITTTTEKVTSPATVDEILQPDICLSKNESGVEYHTRMVGFPIGSMMECRKNPVLHVKYQLNPQLTMMLSLVNNHKSSNSGV
ncbi:hypothetical protein KUTeg_010393 [Tegillarca granosa]|uniref:TMEM248/TMEM219 domain-containing protein n=1 Tax=Tegillarca granosa TaxID=220873 RepID=A0ABQ9FBJ7_TEGGR|nr:hypothetical protein KUTeg_010393 [Tegillarca granosa]